MRWQRTSRRPVRWSEVGKPYLPPILLFKHIRDVPEHAYPWLTHGLVGRRTDGVLGGDRVGEGPLLEHAEDLLQNPLLLLGLLLLLRLRRRRSRLRHWRRRRTAGLPCRPAGRRIARAVTIARRPAEARCGVRRRCGGSR